MVKLHKSRNNPGAVFVQNVKDSILAVKNEIRACNSVSCEVSYNRTEAIDKRSQGENKKLIFGGNIMTNYNYKAEDSGKLGKTFERDLKAAFHQGAKVAKQGKIDFRRDSKCFEVKTGAGELDFLFKSKVKYVAYVPVVAEAQDVTAQEGFILDRETFLECIEEAGLLRNKVSTSGQEKVTIQTFWNHSKNKPHGKKYFVLLDLLYDRSIMTLEEYFDCEGRF